jgi:hypothetical protein
MRRLHVAADAVCCLGLVVIVVGSFLPWVSSGRATRNGYQAGGVSSRLLGLHGLARGALALIPYVAAAAALAVVLVILGHGAGSSAATVSGRVVAIVVAVGSAVGCIEALGADPGFGIAVARSGPVTVLVGVAAACAGPLGLVVKSLLIGKTASPA